MAHQIMPDPPKASLLGLPYELREQIFGYIFQRQEGPTIVKGHRFFWQHHSDKGRRFVGERPRAFLLPKGNDGEYSLFSQHPLSQVNGQLREEISGFLHTAPVEVVSIVEKFDYTHLITFLKSLPPTRLKDFAVHPDIDSDLTRTLRIELSATYDEHWPKRLSAWFKTIENLFGVDEEFSTATSLAPQSKTGWRRFPLQVLYNLHHHWKDKHDGPSKQELRKIMGVLWARLRMEGYVSSGVYQRGRLGDLWMVPIEEEYGRFVSRIWYGF